MPPASFSEILYLFTFSLASMFYISFTKGKHTNSCFLPWRTQLFKWDPLLKERIYSCRSKFFPRREEPLRREAKKQIISWKRRLFLQEKQRSKFFLVREDPVEKKCRKRENGKNSTICFIRRCFH